MRIIQYKDGFEVQDFFQFTVVAVSPKIMLEWVLMWGIYKGWFYDFVQFLDYYLIKLLNYFGKEISIKNPILVWRDNTVQIQNGEVVRMLLDDQWCFNGNPNDVGSIEYVEKMKVHMIKDRRTVKPSFRNGRVYPVYYVKVLLDNRDINIVEEYLKSLPQEAKVETPAQV